VNGRPVSVSAASASRRLSDVLRDDLGLTGTKVGCSAGDCGACTVLLDGEQVCACLVAGAQCAGRSIETVESLAPAAGPLSPLQQAFIDHGAAQCGICTPGMLMAAADTLRRHPQPTEQQVLDGIGGVLCRCTGYRKIVEAVMSVGAANPRTEGLAIGAVAAGCAVGARVERFDARAKVTGAEQFGADQAPADALWLRAIRSPHPRARFVLGDLADWMAAREGLVAVITSEAIPNNRFAIFPDLRDQPALAEGEVRFAGEAIAVVAGSQSAIEALDDASFPVTWEILPPVSGVAAGLAPGAPSVQARWADNILCRGRVVSGNVEEAAAKAPHTLSMAMRTQHVEHAYIEPEAGWARWDNEPDGPRVTIFACTQTPYMDRDEIAWMFAIEPERVRIIPSAVGGGFGGKLDMSVQPLLVAAARRLGRPTRMVYHRPESMRSSTKRHPAMMQAQFAATSDGRFLAYDFTGDFNTGAYASWGPTVANRVPIHAAGPYRWDAVRALTRAVITNDPVAGAFRGFGVPQSTLVCESLIDDYAARIGADPLELRHANALRAGDRTATGQTLHASVGLQACLDALRPAWRSSREAIARWRAQPAGERATAVAAPSDPHGRNPAMLRRGLGVACMWYGIGNTVIANPSEMEIGLKPDGRFVLFNGAIDIGQGTYTIMPQIAADALGVPLALIDQIGSDTALTLDGGKSSASRQTFVSGNAARLAAEDLRKQLLGKLGAPDSARLDLGKGEVRAAGATLALSSLPVDARGLVAVGRGRFNPPTVPLDGDGQGVPYATYGFAAQFAEVEVDVSLGTVRVLAIHAAHDVGRAINPTQVEGQIHGGIAQGLGLALMEDYIALKTDNLHDYLIPTVGDMPPVVVHLVEDPEPLGPNGAKGVGEPALVATAPAILNAIRDATGVRMAEVPVTPDRLLAALRGASGAAR
jgi:CO/xanthine dehydrogenase Mo-binding subunit/aerobic-type carbon monoxide dehydrogenase small subunit (CoxS/CutS family)